MSSAPKIPYVEQLKEIRRELAVRERVYPRFIHEGKISKTEADKRMVALQAVADTLVPLARAEEAAQPKPGVLPLSGGSSP